jgi:hypothetical protein
MKYRFAHSALVLAVLAPLAAWSQVSISVNIGPPPLLAYAQPMVPGDGYIWTPGYWGWSPRDRDYYWIPGTWVLAPMPGYLWTPGYWAFEGGGYLWHLGYWGTHVGFYGGINYGYGYGGSGYDGGRWNGRVFSYNRAYNNVNPTVVRSVYSTRAANYHVNNVAHVSYSGGRGGVVARPTAAQIQAQRAPHTEPTPIQMEHERTAMTTPTQRAAAARTAPVVAATPQPSAFASPGVARSRNEPAVVTAPARNSRQTTEVDQPNARAPSSARMGAAQGPHLQPAEPQVHQAPPAERQAQTRPAQAAQPAQPAERAQPAQHAQPAERAQPAQRAQPAERAQPQAERGQGQGQGEARGKDKRDER